MLNGVPEVTKIIYKMLNFHLLLPYAHAKQSYAYGTLAWGHYHKRSGRLLLKIDSVYFLHQTGLIAFGRVSDIQK